MAGENSRSIPDVLQDILTNVQAIIRSEVRLAKTEVTEEATRAGRAAGVAAAGVVTGSVHNLVIAANVPFCTCDSYADVGRGSITVCHYGDRNRSPVSHRQEAIQDCSGDTGQDN